MRKPILPSALTALALLTCVGAVCPVTIHATEIHEDAKLIASDAEFGDVFGGSVALSGDTIVVGAYKDEHAGGTLAGSAYVFVRSGTDWSEQAKLTTCDAAAYDLFGYSVAVSGDTVVVGARYGDHAGGTNSGSAYVFVRSGTTWSEQAKLTASDATASDYFGTSVAILGDTVVVGALDDGAGQNSGSAYVFLRNGTTWSEQAKLTASDAAADDQFGWSVALSGDTSVVGARVDDGAGQNSGSAYVFVRSGTTWSEQAKLTASDAAADDLFGASVALSGGTALVGAMQNDDAGQNSGSAYIFVRNGTEWSEQVKLTASDAGFGGDFGRAVALSGDTAVVGSPGFTQTAYYFVRSGTTWSEQAKLTASDAAANDAFGYSVAFSGGTVVVGALQDDQQSGSAYLFGGLVSVCGDGVLDPDEECDDGNSLSCDGCSAICEHEVGFVCGDGGLNTDCGEECDDGNDVDGDGCNAECLVEFCGDGITQAGLGEECDDGNSVDGDGCSAECALEEVVISAVGTRGAILLALMLLVAATGLLIWRRRAV